MCVHRSNRSSPSTWWASVGGGVDDLDHVRRGAELAGAVRGDGPAGEPEVLGRFGGVLGHVGGDRLGGDRDVAVRVVDRADVDLRPEAQLELEVVPRVDGLADLGRGGGDGVGQDVDADVEQRGLVLDHALVVGLVRGRRGG